MSDGTPQVDDRLYFGKVSVLLLESNELESRIAAQVLSGFKIRSLLRCSGVSEARDALTRDPVELVIVGHATEQTESFEFIRWLRRIKSERTRTRPVLLLTAHTLRADVILARDCGANFVIAKPLTPEVLYERIRWLGRDARAFISATSYVGPDRRFQKSGPPAGTDGRRQDDVSLQVGEATEPNLSQREIDAMVSFRVVGS